MQFLTCAFAKEGDGTPMPCDYLLVLDVGSAQRLLHTTAGMEARTAVVAMADKQCRDAQRRPALGSSASMVFAWVEPSVGSIVGNAM